MRVCAELGIKEREKETYKPVDGLLDAEDGGGSAISGESNTHDDGDVGCRIQQNGSAQSKMKI